MKTKTVVPSSAVMWAGLGTRDQLDMLDQLVPSSITKAESVLINPLVRMPWIVTRTDGTRILPGTPDYPRWLADPMLLSGDPGGMFAMLDRIDRFNFWAKWVRDAMRHGLGAILYSVDALEQPAAGDLQVIDPRALYDSGQGWAVQIGKELVPINRAGVVTGTGLRVLILRHSISGGIFGRHREELALARRTRTYTGEALDTGVPSGVLSTDNPVSQKQADFARDEWEKRQTQRRIAVLGNGAKYQQIVLSPVDAEIVALLQASDRQVAHMYELSAWELDSPSGDSMTYANAAEKRQDRVDGPLASWSGRIEEALSALLPAGWRLIIDFTEYTMRTASE